MNRNRSLEFPEEFSFSDGTSVERPEELAELVTSDPDRAGELAEHVASGYLTQWLRLINHEQTAQRIAALRRRYEGGDEELVRRVIDLLARDPPGRAREVPEDGEARGGDRGTSGAPGPEPYESDILERQLEAIRKLWSAGERRSDREDEIRSEANRRRAEIREQAEAKTDEIHERLAEARTTLEDAREARERAEEEWRDQKTALVRGVVVGLILLGFSAIPFCQSRATGSGLSIDAAPAAREPAPGAGSQGAAESESNEGRFRLSPSASEALSAPG